MSKIYKVPASEYLAKTLSTRSTSMASRFVRVATWTVRTWGTKKRGTCRRLVVMSIISIAVIIPSTIWISKLLNCYCYIIVFLKYNSRFKYLCTILLQTTNKPFSKRRRQSFSLKKFLGLLCINIWNFKRSHPYIEYRLQMVSIIYAQMSEN